MGAALLPVRNSGVIPMLDFNNKVAVITGGASGVGKAIAERLGREGVRLVLADMERGALETAVAELGARGFDVFGQLTDVTRYESVEKLADLGPVDTTIPSATGRNRCARSRNRKKPCARWRI